MSGRNLALTQAALGVPAGSRRVHIGGAPGRRGLSRVGAWRPLVEVRPHTDRDLALGVLLAMDKAGARFAVHPFGPFRLGGRWRPDGTEDARLVLGPENPALTAEAGARLLGREAGLFAYLVPAASGAGRP
jgi:hypothetical protein